MLEKVPKRLKILERDFLESGNPNKLKISAPEKKESKEKAEKNPQRERKQANKNKASQANHNRKAHLARKTPRV